MDSNINFTVNSRIEIDVDSEIYKSNIQDVSEDCISISIPVNNHKYMPLSKGEKVDVIYYEEKNVYKFNTVVVGRKIERILMIMLKKPEKVQICQRRNFVRVPLILDVLCAIFPLEKDLYHLNDQVEVFKACSVDMSGGGMKIVVDVKMKDKLKYGDIIIVTIPMENDSLTLKGKLVRISNNKDESKLTCGLSFIDMDRNSRERIIRVLFQIMRQHIKKGAKED
jgi:c-di-GMP-binding flagellar brake protein YcgR